VISGCILEGRGIETMSKSATLMGVAEHAGVSTATVARVLKKNGYVKEETRKRVEEAIRQTGYRLNGVARGLRTNRSMTIGNFLRSTTHNPFFAEIARGIEDEALRNDHTVILLNMEASRERERLGVERLIERRVDAMIFTYALDVESLDIAAAAGIPTVQVERVLDRPTSAVVVDNAAGSIQAVEHLVHLGHRRIGFIGADPVLYRALGVPNSVEEERLAGYRQGLQAAGIGYADDIVFLGRYFAADKEPITAWGQMGMRHLLQAEQRPTAVLITSDVLAAGALQVAYEVGLRVPDDISIVGFDATIGRFLSPALTTVSHPLREMGKVACELALAAIAGDTAPRVVRLQTKLEIRGSTGAPPSCRKFGRPAEP
jgi:LacI family transcriptional regulator